jgi:hypothetical protein
MIDLVIEDGAEIRVFVALFRHKIFLTKWIESYRHLWKYLKHPPSKAVFLDIEAIFR